MDDVQRSRIRLAHWIEHNEDHLKGYREVHRILKSEGRTAAAEEIARGIELIEQANRHFEAALAALPAPEGGARTHKHEHAHHSHDNQHDHGHSHGGGSESGE